MKKQRKNIAVFLPSIYSEYISSLRKSLEEEAKRKGCYLVFFTCFGDNITLDNQIVTNMRYDEGERSIFRLANLAGIDGVIILHDEFARTQYEEIFDMLRCRCPCPVVNFRTPHQEKGVYNVLVDNRTGFADIIRHFIEVHHASKLELVTGPRDNPHSEFRLEIYKEVLEEYGIPFKESQVHWGNFWKNCGEDIVEEMLENDSQLPEAIICANDYMAISVIDALKARGVDVPEDVLVSGYDDVEESRYSHPQVTTVGQPVEAMGKKAIEILEKLWEGGEVEQNTYLPEKVILRQSCGCGQAEEDSYRSYAKEISDKLGDVYSLETAASTMVTMMSNARDLGDIVASLKKYALRNTGFKSFALCLADHWEEELPLPGKDYGSSTCMITMEMGIHKGKALEKERFPICQLLPKVFARDTEDFIYVIPLHYLQQYMGYVLVQIDYDVPSNANLKSWFIHLASALENFRTKKKLHQFAAELEKLYVRDTLTGLYNRRGLEKYGSEFYQYCQEQNTNFVIMEIDMDGLKQINDAYGHDEGDFCIITIANAMNFAAENGEVCIRSGGDEYIVIGKDYSQTALDRFLQKFEEFIQSANDSADKPYTLGASLGYYMGIPDGVHTVENYLKIADDRMYENKKNRKALLYGGAEVR